MAAARRPGPGTSRSDGEEAPGAGRAGDDHRLRLGFLLARVGRDAWGRFEQALEPLGLRPRHLVVLMELHQRRPTTQRALLDALGFDAGTLVALLNDLEGQALLTRRRDPADRRRHIVEPTPMGTTRLAEAERAVTAAEEELLGDLDAVQRHQLWSALRQVQAARQGAATLGGAPRAP